MVVKWPSSKVVIFFIGQSLSHIFICLINLFGFESTHHNKRLSKKQPFWYKKHFQMKQLLLIFFFHQNQGTPKVLPSHPVIKINFTSKISKCLFPLNPNWHELWKQKECLSLAPHWGIFYKTRLAWQGAELTQLISIFTSKTVIENFNKNSADKM